MKLHPIIFPNTFPWLFQSVLFSILVPEVCLYPVLSAKMKKTLNPRQESNYMTVVQTETFTHKNNQDQP